MVTITRSVELTVTTCPDCAGVYAISQEFKDEAYRLGGFKKCWTCPYCKAERGYGTGAMDKLNQQIAAKEEEKRRLASDRDWYQQRAKDKAAEAEHFRKSRDGMKGALARTKKRHAAGVCPCCQRQFKQLVAHMKSQHPDYKP